MILSSSKRQEAAPILLLDRAYWKSIRWALLLPAVIFICSKNEKLTNDNSESIICNEQKEGSI